MKNIFLCITILLGSASHIFCVDISRDATHGDNSTTILYRYTGVLRSIVKIERLQTRQQINHLKQLLSNTEIQQDTTLIEDRIKKLEQQAIYRIVDLSAPTSTAILEGVQAQAEFEQCDRTYNEQMAKKFSSASTWD